MNENTSNNNWALHNSSNSSIGGEISTTGTNSSSGSPYYGIPYTDNGTGVFNLPPLYPKDPISYDFTSVMGNLKKDAITELTDQINGIKNIEYRMISLIKTIESSDHFRELLYKSLDVELLKKTLNLYSEDEIALLKV